MDCNFPRPQRSSSIPIPKPLKKSSTSSEYELTQHLFDPAKNTPPNNFIDTLRQRIHIYCSPPKTSSSPQKHLVNLIKRN